MTGSTSINESGVLTVQHRVRFKTESHGRKNLQRDDPAEAEQANKPNSGGSRGGGGGSGGAYSSGREAHGPGH